MKRCLFYLNFFLAIFMLDLSEGTQTHSTKKRILGACVPYPVIDSLNRVLNATGEYEFCILSDKCARDPDLLPHTDLWPFEHYSREGHSMWFVSDDPVVFIDDFSSLLESPPYAIIVSDFAMHYQSEHNLYEAIWPDAIRSGRTKIVYYSGFVHSNPPKGFKNYLCADGNIYDKKFQKAFPHRISWIPWIDFEGKYAYEGPSDSMTVGTYQNDLDTHPGYKNDYSIYKECVQKACSVPCAVVPEFKYCSRIPHDKIPAIMDETFATLHVKHIEGFGYAILESLFKGKPVFLYVNDWAKQRGERELKCLNWCIEGKTAYMFSSVDEFLEKFRPFLNNPALRIAAQERCARTIREIIDFEAEKNRVKVFFDHLLPQYE